MVSNGFFFVSITRLVEERCSPLSLLTLSGIHALSIYIYGYRLQLLRPVKPCSGNSWFGADKAALRFVIFVDRATSVTSKIHHRSTWRLLVPNGLDMASFLA